MVALCCRASPARITLMFNEKLDRFACAALDLLGRALAALRELAWVNRRMTAKGLVSAAVFLGARYGLDISQETQALLATLLFTYLGLAGRDKQRRRTQ